MTDATSPAPASTAGSSPAYAAGTTYSVTLKRNVEWPRGSGIMHSPRKNPHKMTGAVCMEIADAIADTKPL